MNILTCPVCGEKLNIFGKTLKCDNNHSFDFAKQGYVNLLLTSKSGDKKGDSRESAHARREFLQKGYYSFLRDYVNSKLNGTVLDICCGEGYYSFLRDYVNSKLNGTVLDICCGEGYYDEYSGELYGFDISKEMVRLAATSRKEHNYFVANLAHIPVCDNSIDTAMHLFAPFNEKEFYRVIKPGGRLLSVIPGDNHLIELKNILYDTPYLNDEKAPEPSLFTLKSKNKISNTFDISRDDLKTLFSMTPYFYRTSESDKAKLDRVKSIRLTASFVVLEYAKEG